jgi:hypothetical protein
VRLCQGECGTVTSSGFYAEQHDGNALVRFCLDHAKPNNPFRTPKLEKIGPFLRLSTLQNTPDSSDTHNLDLEL